MTLADQVTLARLGLMPVIVAAYLLLPVEHHWCFWVAAWLCGLAEYTDLMDGRIARARGEVSDFGKLADPFCDVIYRCGVFLAMLLPAGGLGYAVTFDPAAAATALGEATARYDLIPAAALWPGQVVYAVDGGSAFATSPVPWLPVMLMVMREVVAGALRAMTATKGLVLAARTSGKVKAWVQGITLITLLAFPACFWYRAQWHLAWGWYMTWACALVSVGSIIEYIWVNRGTLGQLIDRKPG